MQRRTFLRTVGAATAGLSAIGTASAGDSPRRETYRPGGPWPGDEHAQPMDGFHTNEELARALQKLDTQSDRLSLRELGRSAGLNAPIWEATVGEGDTSVHLITQIHGDEAVGTEVALKLLQQLAQGNGQTVETILDELTLTVVPRVNPDGALFEYDVDDDGTDEWVGRRTNTQPWTEADSRYEPYYHYTFPADARPGYDMNRDFNVLPPSEFGAENTTDDQWVVSDGDGYLDMEYEGYTLRSSGLRLSPEVQAVTRSYLDADPDYAITHHHQGQYLVPDSGDGNKPPKQTELSVMPAYGPAYRERSPFNDPDAPVEQIVDPFIDEATSTESIQMNVLVANTLAERGDSVFDSVTRYGYYPLWGSYLDTVCPTTGAAGMLYETSYQTDTRGQQALGRMMQSTKVGFMTTFEALADGSLGDVNVDDYFDLPLHGEYLSNPHQSGR